VLVKARSNLERLQQIPAGDRSMPWLTLCATEVVWRAADEDRVVAITEYRWNGTVLEPVDE
jgi:hypothetical protein